MKNAAYANRTCPYLGLMDDADTSQGFPTNWNYCHRSRPIASPKLEYQIECCLSENHLQCPIFTGPRPAAPLPAHLRASSNHANKPSRGLSRIFAYISAGIMVLAGLAWGFFTPDPISLNETPTSSVDVPKKNIATQTSTNIVTLTRVPTVTMILTSSPALTVSKHCLDVPIGADYKFVIHRVVGGENFNQYADKYNTSVKAIVAVNYNLKTPVRVGKLVIIPVGFTELSDLPDFETYELTETGKSLDTLAQELGVSVRDLKYYNAIGSAESLEAGDWLLVPRSKLIP